MQSLSSMFFIVASAAVALGYEPHTGTSEEPLEPKQCPDKQDQRQARSRSYVEATERNSAGLTRLHFAAYKGDLESAQQLLQNGASVNAQSNTGHTPLHVACQEGHLEMVQLFLRAGAALEVRATAGITPLYLAAQKKQLKVVQVLLQNGADVGGATDTGNSPLHFAAEYGHVEVGRILLQKGDVNAITKAGHTPLHLAARQRKGASISEAAAKLEMVRMLLASGAVVDIQDSTGHTPLHLAAHAGLAQVVRILLEHGALANRLSSRELTALDMAVYGTPPDPDAFVEAATRATIAVLMSFSGSLTIVHPWTNQTTLHVMAYLGLDSLVPPEAAKDCRFHLQQGDGIEARLASEFAIRQEKAHLQAFERAIRLEPTSSTAHMRLGAARARLGASYEHQSGRSLHREDAHTVQEVQQAAEQNEASMVQAFKNAWRLQPDGFRSAEEFVRSKAELAMVGRHKEDLMMGAAQHIEDAQQLAVHWEVPAQQPAAMRRALNLWRQQGVVLFTGLLNESIVSELRQAAQDALAETPDTPNSGVVDRSSNIRASAGRTLRAVSVERSAKALAAISAAIAPFLSAALGDSSQLLLEIAAYRVAPGAATQEWHRDDPVRDLRVASVQFALSDTHADQGALEVQPGTHGFSQDGRSAEVTAAMGQGSVLLYSPFILHRGRANTLPTERLAVTATLLGANGLIPNGIPLAVQPEDAGRWWLVDDGLQHAAT